MSGQGARRLRRAEYARQPYVGQIHDAIARGALRILPGATAVLTVAHDRWCPALAGRGWCNCAPELGGLVYRPVGEVQP